MVCDGEGEVDDVLQRTASSNSWSAAAMASRGDAEG
jgi:hypothetical protein